MVNWLAKLPYKMIAIMILLLGTLQLFDMLFKVPLLLKGTISMPEFIVGLGFGVFILLADYVFLRMINVVMS